MNLLSTSCTTIDYLNTYILGRLYVMFNQSKLFKLIYRFMYCFEHFCIVKFVCCVLWFDCTGYYYYYYLFNCFATDHHAHITACSVTVVV